MTASAAKYIPGFDANNRHPEESERLQKESRKRGRLYKPVLDVECAADGCDRIFVPRVPDQEHCARHRMRETRGQVK